MKSFSQYIEEKHPDIQIGENQYAALEKAIHLAFEKYPSEVRSFFKDLNDPEIDEICEELERPPEYDPVNKMFGHRRKKEEPDEIAPHLADTGQGETEQD